MKKILATLIIIILSLCALIPTVKGVSFKFIATPDKTDAKSGDIITISLKISDIDAGELGINTFKCSFKYDESIFEEVKITSKNNWSITYNDQKENEEYGTLLAVLLSAGVTEDQEIGEITLKLKEDTQGKTGNITFTEVSSNDGQVTITDTDKTIVINIAGEQTVDDDNNDNDQNTEEQEPQNEIAEDDSNIIINTIEDDVTISKDPIPQTGNKGEIIFIGVIISAIVALIAIIKLKRYKKTK